jgi:hypothetical protein
MAGDAALGKILSLSCKALDSQDSRALSSGVPDRDLSDSRCWAMACARRSVSPISILNLKALANARARTTPYPIACPSIVPTIFATYRSLNNGIWLFPIHPRNPPYYDILSAFERETGLPVLVNTSFNVHEEPIVNTPAECVKALRDGRIDFVVTDQGLYDCPRS